MAHNDRDAKPVDDPREGRLNLLLEAASQGIFEHDLVTGEMYCNPTWAKTLGYAADEIEASPLAWIERMHPDDREPFRRALVEHLDGGSPYFWIEFRMRNKAGEWQWLSCQAKTVAWDEKGRPRRLVGACSDISEPHAMRRALREASQRNQELGEILNDSPVVVFLRRRGKGQPVLLASENVRQFGYAPLDLSQDSAGYLSILHPEDQARVEAELEAAAAARQDKLVQEYRILTKDGQTRWVEDRVRLKRDESGQATLFQGVVLDITERKQAVEELRTGEERFRAVIETARDSIFIKDRELRFTHVNPAMEANLGMPADRLLGRAASELFGQAAAAETEALELRVLAGESVEAEHTLPPGPASQAAKHFHVIRVPMRDKAGGIVGLIGVARNITERAHLEESLRQAKEAAEVADRAKGEFLANVSHEIRTPLNAIQGFVSLAMRTVLTGRQRDYLDKVRSSTTHLLKIIEDILDFSKIESGKIEIERIPFRLRELLDSLGDLFSAKAAEKEIELVIACGEEVPDALVGDPLRLKQVLVNLLSNALRFTKKGEVVLEVSARKDAPGKASLHFLLRDTGIGIAPESQKRLFQPFSQADGSITRSYGGTGLGLAISGRLLHFMGGTIELASEPGKGSVFAFTLRFNRQAGPETNPIPAQALPKGARVLIVEPNASVVGALSAHLAAFGARVEAAASAGEALARLRRAATDAAPFRLALVSRNLGEKSGLALAATLQEDPELRSLPIILMSFFGQDQEEEVKRLAAVGIKGFLAKPIKRALLFEVIRDVLGQGKGTAGSEIVTKDTLQRNRFSGTRALLVEDNAINRRFASEVLSLVGIIVEEARDGREALDILEQDATGERFDVVLMDIQMPEMGGIEATRRIRGEARFNRMPVVAMTAYAMPGDREFCLAAGMNDYLTKPIDMDVLYVALDKWIKPKPAEGKSAGPIKDAAPEGPGKDAEAPLSIEGFDVEDTLRRLRGNTRLFRGLLADFCAERGDGLADLRQAILAKDAEKARRILHTLRGMSGNIGAVALRRSAEALSEAIKSKEATLLGAAFADLEATLSRTMRAARRFLEAASEAEEAGKD